MMMLMSLLTTSCSASDRSTSWLVASKPAGVTVHEGSDLLSRWAEGAGPLFPVHALTGRPPSFCSPRARNRLHHYRRLQGATKRYRGVLTGVPRKAKAWAAPISNKERGGVRSGSQPCRGGDGV